MGSGPFLLSGVPRVSSRSKSWFRAPRASVAALLTCLGCASGSSAVSSRPSSPEAPSMKSSPSRPELVARLVARHGEAHRARIERGVAQVATLWREEDGDLEAFVTEYFIPDEAALDATLARLEQAFEQLDGHLNEVGRELRRPTDLDLGPLLPVDA